MEKLFDLEWTLFWKMFGFWCVLEGTGLFVWWATTVWPYRRIFEHLAVPREKKS